MKTGIHPQYFTDAVITCANCSAKLKTGATKQDIQVEICSKCHPFFTGKNVLIDTEGRVDKFRKAQDAAGGRKKKSRKKKTLEERVNEELAVQLGKDKAKEEKEAAKREAKRAAKAETFEVVEEVEEIVEEAPKE